MYNNGIIGNCEGRMEIKKLATVQMGYSFRSRLERSKKGNIAIIQMKDLLDNNTVGCDELLKIEMDSVKEHHLAVKGDLIFRSRGLVATSAILLDDPGRAIVASPLLRIRIVAHDKILPEYLNWYIGQRDAQIFLATRTAGSAQKMINKEAIEELEVALPNLEKQKEIVNLAALAAREQSLFYILAKKKEQYISTVLLKYAKGE